MKLGLLSVTPSQAGKLVIYVVRGGGPWVSGSLKLRLKSDSKSCIKCTRKVTNSRPMWLGWKQNKESQTFENTEIQSSNHAELQQLSSVLCSHL